MNAENIIFALGMFAIILVAYGQSLGTVSIQNNVNTLFAPFPSPGDVYNQFVATHTQNCSALDFGCQASNGVAQATAAIAASIGLPGVYLFNVLNRITAFGSIMSFAIFGSGEASLFSIPFAPLFVLALGIVLVFFAFKMIRGNPGL